MTSWETVTELSISRPPTCIVDGKEVEFGKGWDVPIELRNMRWEGGGRSDGCNRARSQH